MVNIKDFKVYFILIYCEAATRHITEK